MPRRLESMQIAIIATDGVEEVELTRPRAAVEAEGAVVHLISLGSREIQATNSDDELADRFLVDESIDDVSPDDYDGLILPGGTANPDRLRRSPAVISFVQKMFAEGKPVGAICHAPWVLVEANVVAGRILTCFPSLRTDIANAGGTLRDEAVVAHEGLVTSRESTDLAAFCEAIVEELAAGLNPEGFTPAA